jgi:hypothetical protein
MAGKGSTSVFSAGLPGLWQIDTFQVKVGVGVGVMVTVRVPVGVGMGTGGIRLQGPSVSPCRRWAGMAGAGRNSVFSAGLPGLWQMRNLMVVVGVSVGVMVAVGVMVGVGVTVRVRVAVGLMGGVGVRPQGPRVSPWRRWPGTAEAGNTRVFSAGVPGLWQMVTIPPSPGSGVPSAGGSWGSFFC